jgi:hypothetical protein
VVKKLAERMPDMGRKMEYLLNTGEPGWVFCRGRWGWGRRGAGAWEERGFCRRGLVAGRRRGPVSA